MQKRTARYKCKHVRTVYIFILCNMPILPLFVYQSPPWFGGLIYRPLFI